MVTSQWRNAPEFRSRRCACQREHHAVLADVRRFESPEWRGRECAVGAYKGAVRSPQVEGDVDVGAGGVIGAPAA